MDLGHLMNRFRLASRDLRNHYFHPGDWDADGWDVVAWFMAVERSLFVNLVLYPAGLPLLNYGQPNPSITVVLNSPHAPIMVNRIVDSGSGYWDHPIKTVDNTATLFFVEFFDWDQLEYRDNRYAHVVIAAHPSLAELAGRHALIETHYVTYAKAATAAV